ncbi:carbonic anhydrase 2-like isoform X2 [Convolutriloba macropyga]
MKLDNSWSHKTQHKWPEQFPISKNGKRQSPIDIKEREAVKKWLPMFNLELIEGNLSDEWSVCNNGHTINVTPPSNVKWQLSGSMLEGRYILDHFHCHWGPHWGNCGCEHLLDGKKHEGEIHFVFKWAPGQEKEVVDQIAVWGVMMKSSKETDPKFQFLIDHLIGNNLTKIMDPKSEPVKIPVIDFQSLVPQGVSEYFIYQGSLTTPPFSEIVMHIVYKEPIAIASSFFDLLRNLNDLEGGKLVSNFRPIQPLNGRTVYLSS